jgi:hypothetical protein
MERKWISKHNLEFLELEKLKLEDYQGLDSRDGNDPRIIGSGLAKECEKKHTAH